MKGLGVYDAFFAASYLFGVSYAQVFAHYLAGSVTKAHAAIDVSDAKTVGLDAFALNVGDPTQPFVNETLQYLFEAANAAGDFYLFISLDVDAYAGSLSNYAYIFDWVLDQPSYYMGPSSHPFISTFSSGGLQNTDWTTWKIGLDRTIYFCPDFDDTAGYYLGSDSYAGWYSYWGPVVDCVFSWESAWPAAGDPNPGASGGASPGDVSLDVTVITGAKENSKAYMMGLSSLQYKDGYGANLYRLGDLTLPARMANIFGMTTQPDFVEVLTWNDGPESHDVGSLWPEANSDSTIGLYQQNHTAWQPLITSFLTAWKAGGSTAAMTPPSGTPGAGAMWYRSLPMDAVCSLDDGFYDQTYYEKPDGFDSGTDTINWAIVIPNSNDGSTLNVYSNGDLVHTETVKTGLNYNNIATRNPGAQLIQLVSASGTILMSATGGECVYEPGECLKGIYDMNFNVLPFVLGAVAATCT